MSIIEKTEKFLNEVGNKSKVNKVDIFYDKACQVCNEATKGLNSLRSYVDVMEKKFDDKLLSKSHKQITKIIDDLRTVLQNITSFANKHLD